jgi:hypothetical protein
MTTITAPFYANLPYYQGNETVATNAYYSTNPFLYSYYRTKPSLIGTLLFPGRKSLLPASTVPEMPATFFPSLNYPRSDYNNATSDLNYLLENHRLKPGTEGNYGLNYTPVYNQPYNQGPTMYERYNQMPYSSNTSNFTGFNGGFLV